MREPKFCFKHPTRIAKRKCFVCARPLCPECQIKREHHLFCTDLCHKTYLGNLSARTPKPYARYALYATGIVLIGGLIYFALLADAFYSGGDQRPQPAFKKIAPSLPVDLNPPPPRQAITISRPLNGM